MRTNSRQNNKAGGKPKLYKYVLREAIKANYIKGINSFLKALFPQGLVADEDGVRLPR